MHDTKLRDVLAFYKESKPFVLGANIALVERRSSSDTRRLNHINLHRFWARRPGIDDNLRLGVGLGDSEVVKESNQKCLLQYGRFHTLKR